jgi:pimeloyl-ACP methyl ester carboxylesterase
MVAKRTSRSRRGNSIWRVLVFGAVGLAIVLAAATVLVPGMVRLALVQPLRDVMFFQREIAPFDRFEQVERIEPRPSRTDTLPPSPTDADSVALAVDLWVPERTPAPTVLLLHGSSPRGRALGFNRLLAMRLQQHGWLVLTPDARGFGDSGTPQNWREPEAWSSAGDLARLVDYARSLPDADGVLIAIGHSLGASHLLQLDLVHADLAALVLIGPSRHPAGHRSSWSERVRFAADRGVARIMPQEVVDADFARTELQRFATAYAATGGPPLLLLDGEREGARLHAALAAAATVAGDHSRHVTVAGSHHYCGAYQLPWAAHRVHVRAEVFERCFTALSDFLGNAIEHRPAQAAQAGT